MAVVEEVVGRRTFWVVPITGGRHSTGGRGSQLAMMGIETGAQGGYCGKTVVGGVDIIECELRGKVDCELGCGETVRDVRQILSKNLTQTQMHAYA